MANKDRYSNLVGGIMSKQDRAAKATHNYIAAVPSCGCVVAACVDMGDKDTAKDVANWIKQGLTISRIGIEEYRRRCAAESNFMRRCPHGKDNAQRALFEEAG